MNNEIDGIFDIGWEPENKSVTISFPCCDHENPGIECVNLTPEKAVFMAQLLLEKVLAIYWSQKEKG